MSTAHDIIRDEELEAGIELDPNFDTGKYLCYGESCHEECSCWDSFTLAIRKQLELQKRAEVKSPMFKGDN